MEAHTAPSLFERVGYRPALEAEAFERLAALDVDGCRKRFGSLIGRLDVAGSAGDQRQLVGLLLDVLHKVNRVVHRGPSEEVAYQRNRLLLIEEFAGCDTARAARERFMAALNRLLAVLRRVPGDVHPLVRRAALLIEQGYHGPIGLSSVARRLNVSPNYLSRLFRRDVGATMTAYIQRLRLEHARLLLADPGRSIAEIAFQVGYRNYRDFYRNFVKQEKLSPSEARRRMTSSRLAWRARGPRPAESRPNP